MQISLKNIKECAWVGDDGGAFEASVYIDGNRAGRVSNDGYGGPNDYEPSSLYDTIKRHTDGLGQVTEFGETFDMTPDVFIEQLIDKAATEKWEKRVCKGKTLVRFEDTKEGTWRSFKVPYQEGIVARIERQTGKKVVECLNQKYM